MDFSIILNHLWPPFDAKTNLLGGIFLLSKPQVKILMFCIL